MGLVHLNPELKGVCQWSRVTAKVMTQAVRLHSSGETTDGRMKKRGGADVAGLTG